MLMWWSACGLWKRTQHSIQWHGQYVHCTQLTCFMNENGPRVIDLFCCGRLCIMLSAKQTRSHRTSACRLTWHFIYGHGTDANLSWYACTFFRRAKNVRYTVFGILFDYIELCIQMCTHRVFFSVEMSFRKIWTTTTNNM